MNEETYQPDEDESLNTLHDDDMNEDLTEEEKEEKAYEENLNKVYQWLAEKKVSKTKQKDYRDQIEVLAREMCEGWLRFDEDLNFIQTLKFPFPKVKELKYKKRISKDEVEPYTKGIDPQDGEGRVRGYVCALTSMPHAQIRQLDTEDATIPNAIAVFFIS